MAKKIPLDQLRRISKTRGIARPKESDVGAERHLVPDLPKPDREG